MRKLELVMIAAAVVGAVATGSYPEAAVLVLLYLGCRLLERYIISASRAKIENNALMQAENGWTYEKAVAAPMRVEHFADNFAKFFPPVMAAAGAAAALIPSLVTGDWTYWVRVGCTFLIIGCTGTLAASVSLAKRCGIAAASARSIFFKSGEAMENISNMKVVALGKGALTDGKYGLQRVVPAIAFEEEDDEDGEEQEMETEEELILRLCAGAAEGLSHPAVRSILRAAEAWKIRPDQREELIETSEDGVCAKLPEGIVCFGDRKYFREKKIRLPEPVQAYGMQIYVALDGEHIGTLILQDSIVQGAESLIMAIRHVGAKTVLMTEESTFNAETIARHLNIDQVRAELSGEKKAETMKDLRRKMGVTLYLGDGEGDASIMAAAEVSGSFDSGAAEAVEAADILYAGKALQPMEDSIDLAYLTTRVASENVFLACLIKAGIIFLGLVGYANLWLTILADIGVAVICLVNAVHILATRKYRFRKKAPQ